MGEPAPSRAFEVATTAPPRAPDRTRADHRGTDHSSPGGEEALLLGMPQLAAAGLSEPWLLKELGHRHWLMLARAAGMAVPDFRDETGAPVYAAFCAVRIEDARFELACENGTLSIASSIVRISRTQVLGRHRLRIDGHPAGAVEMVSTFVRRTNGSNHSIARIALNGPMPIDANGARLPALAAEFRARRVERHLGFDMAGSRELASFAFEPCPAQDFNGAGFLYFPSFFGFVDRAEWQLDRRPFQALVRRDAFYYANIDPGETLRVALMDTRRIGEAGHLRRWQLRRGTSGALIADVFTARGR